MARRVVRSELEVCFQEKNFGGVGRFRRRGKGGFEYVHPHWVTTDMEHATRKQHGTAGTMRHSRSRTVCVRKRGEARCEETRSKNPRTPSKGG
jgi:hypothetical protein